MSSFRANKKRRDGVTVPEANDAPTEGVQIEPHPDPALFAVVPREGTQYRGLQPPWGCRLRHRKVEPR